MRRLFAGLLLLLAAATVSSADPLRVDEQVIVTVALSGQTAAIGTTTLHTPAVSRHYLVIVEATITTAAGTSSTLGGIGVQYTDAQTGTPLSPIVSLGNTSNAVGGRAVGQALIFAAAGVPITYNVGYASNPASAMTYILRVRLVEL